MLAALQSKDLNLKVELQLSALHARRIGGMLAPARSAPLHEFAPWAAPGPLGAPKGPQVLGGLWGQMEKP